jgi:hypothetical protein
MTEMAGFTVILGDIAAASGAFRTGSGEFASAVPDGLQASGVDSGDGSLDGTINTVLQGIDSMRDRIVQALQETSGKLQQSHDKYQATDGESARFLYDDMYAEPAVGSN